MCEINPHRRFLFEKDAAFRSCHASTVLALADGTVLIAYFAGEREGASDVGIWLSRRVGGVWEKPVCIAKSEQTAHWNPVLFEAGAGVRLVYKVGRDVPSWKSRTRMTYDRGASWSEETVYPDQEDACGPVRSKPLPLSNGRLLAPNSVETASQWQPRVDVSDDGGESFTTLAWIPVNRETPHAPNYIEGKGAIQPTLWESSPGHIHALLRTTCGFIFRSDSTDGGKSWCEAYSTLLPNNNSGIETAQNGSDLYLLMNPVSGNWASRTPLVLLRSSDNGRSFQPYLTLEDELIDPETGKGAEFSYPSAVVRDGKLYIAYTHMRRRIAFCELSLS